MVAKDIARGGSGPEVVRLAEGRPGTSAQQMIVRLSRPPEVLLVTPRPFWSAQSGAELLSWWLLAQAGAGSGRVNKERDPVALVQAGGGMLNLTDSWCWPTPRSPGAMTLPCWKYHARAKP